MKDLNRISCLMFVLGLMACDSSSTPISATAPAAVVSTPVVVASPTPTPTVSPTPTPVVLTLSQKISILKLDKTFVTVNENNDEIPIIINAATQSIRNVSADPSWSTNDPLGVHFEINQLTINNGTLSQDESFYLAATGSILIYRDGYNIDPAYQNIADGNLYFSISNQNTGPWGVNPFSVFISGPIYNDPGSYSITTGCGVLELYTDQAMTNRVSLLGNSVNCGLL